MIIRKATLNDLPFIQKLNNILFELEIAHYDPYLTKNWPLSNEGWEYFHQSIINDLVIVAEYDNKIVGYLLGALTEIPYYDFPIAELCNMCVDPTYQGKGIGTKLFLYFKEYYNNKGIFHFIVTASYKNENARKFYKKLGFNEANVTLTHF